MKRLSLKKSLCMLITASLLLAAGCSSQSSTVENDSQGNLPEGAQESSVGEKNAEMGRYAEEEIDLTEELEIVSGMKKLPDGRLIITDETSGIWESKDQGATWENVENSWLTEKMSSVYFMDIQMAPDGTLGVVFNDYSGEPEEEESNGLE